MNRASHKKNFHQNRTMTDENVNFNCHLNGNAFFWLTFEVTKRLVMDKSLGANGDIHLWLMRN